MNQVHTDPVVTQLHSELSETIDDQKPEMGFKNIAAALEQNQFVKKRRDSYFETDIVWKNVIAFLILHLGFFYGNFLLLTFQVPLPTIIWTAVVLYFLSKGVTIGSHRMWSHRSFKGTPALKTILLIAQTIAGQNCIWIWSRDHRMHHKYSDTNADPHNSRRGFFFCHMGWLMMKKHPDVIAKGKTIDMSDLDADPFVMFQKKYYIPLYVIFAFFLPATVPVYFWSDSWKNAIYITYFVRYLLTLHGTWCVNSVAHFYGTRPYTKDIAPVESAFVSIITLGEGWHNYHHTFPWDYKAGEAGKLFEGSAGNIEWLAKHGYAYDLRTATPEMIICRIKKKGDGTHPLHAKLNKANYNNEHNLEGDTNDKFGEKIGYQIKVSSAG